MSKKKAAYYVVWVGKTPGIYDNWEDCEAQVKGTAGAKYKGFASREAAEQALADGADKHIIRKPKAESGDQSPISNLQSPIPHPILPALAVDAACSGNPGVMEFRGVIADTGTEVFHRGPFQAGTNNIGEFLAIVLGLAYLKQNHLPWALYSDSRTALAWLKKKHADTKIEWNASNQDLFYMIRKAEMWLHDNTWTTPVYKWDTKKWGEIPADFGRK
ncbi:MAG: ribonuclease H family protein [Paludibacteraceae bacterium]|nr:ribonuclease H family protein [Paludibacteraceae bacterium]